MPRLLAFLLCAINVSAAAAEPSLRIVEVFPIDPKHNHASCVVELPGGDLFVAWYRGSGERTADDVAILASRLKTGETAWGRTFVLADTPGYPDCNPAVFVAPDGTLWLFRPTILDHRWEGALLKFSATKTYPDADRPPRWDREGVLHITPKGFAEDAAQAVDALDPARRTLVKTLFAKDLERTKDELYQRLGWMPRVHPLVLPSGRWLLPLYTDTFSASIALYTDDSGGNWSTGRPMIGFGNIQPSFVRRGDGTIVAFMRENGPRKAIRMSTSRDDGVTWTSVTDAPLPNPGAGIEAIRLASGRWAIVYNDTTEGRHTLAVSSSDDEGVTWSHTRHVAVDPAGKESFHYPSMIQASDGRIHVTYTHGGRPGGSTIEHATFDEAWLLGDESKPGAK